MPPGCRFGVVTAGRRFAVLVAAAAAAGIGIGLLLPGLSPFIGTLTGRYAAVGPAADALRSLRVADVNRVVAPYDRDAFGFREYDPDGNGCDARNDVLARDLDDVTFGDSAGCIVSAGVLDDPYTGRRIEFSRGRLTSARVQIDHVVSLSDAWRSGADGWNTMRRFEFANDPANLLAVDGDANGDKGDASAAYWLPPNEDYGCEYVARQIGVKSAYGLSVTTRERAAMFAVLADCPSQPLP